LDQASRRALFRHAEKAGDHDDRQGPGEGRQEVGLRRLEPVRQPRGEGRDPGRERGDPPPGEGAQHEVARPGVVGRLAAESAVAQERVHGLPASGAGMAAPLPEEEGLAARAAA
jgi:hypothetical protein